MIDYIWLDYVRLAHQINGHPPEYPTLHCVRILAVWVRLSKVMLGLVFASHHREITLTLRYFMLLKYIVTCRVVRVTKMTGSSSDDWIY
jgi:hypothetical protein